MEEVGQREVKEPELEVEKLAEVVEETVNEKEALLQEAKELGMSV